MQTVSRFEANLLRLLYYFLRREPAEAALPLVEARWPTPLCLSRPAVRLVQDALAKGCTYLLATRGGWRDERFLRGERAVGGRLWERTKPEDMGLKFTGHTLAFLVWIAAARPGDKSGAWDPQPDQLTPADLLLLYFAHEGLRTTPEGLGAPALRKRPAYAGHGLCWLAYPQDFTDMPLAARPDFAPWTIGLGACILEAVQPDLADRWYQVESGKASIRDPHAMRALGMAQDRVLTAFLDAVEAANRRDLARFLLRAASRCLVTHAHAGMWAGGLEMGGMRLADRAGVYQAAAAFLRHLDRLQGWTRWARSVGRFDEGYAAAQLWLADWEQAQHGATAGEEYLRGDHKRLDDWELAQGDALVARAQSIVRGLDPMRQG
jgi:hypothetical protein